MKTYRYYFLSFALFLTQNAYAEIPVPSLCHLDPSNYKIVVKNDYQSYNNKDYTGVMRYAVIGYWREPKGSTLDAMKRMDLTNEKWGESGTWHTLSAGNSRTWKGDPNKKGCLQKITVKYYFVRHDGKKNIGYARASASTWVYAHALEHKFTGTETLYGEDGTGKWIDKTAPQ